MLLALLPSCVYDDLPCPEGGGGAGIDGGPLTLTFTVGVPAMGTDGKEPGTRAIFYGNPVYYEDWIDTQDGLRVLFFLRKREKTGSKYVEGQYADDHQFVAIDSKNPLKDYFLFESTSRWVSQLPYDEDGNLRYQVTVPVYQIGNEESQYREHWPRIRELLRTYDFKIAILANHPEGLSWDINNSVLSAPDIDNLATATGLKTINDIHHSVPDNQYSNGSSGRKEGYQMLVDDKNKINGLGTMGPFIDWVIMRSKLYGDALGGTFDTRVTARTWIRDYWRPDLKYNENTDPDIDFELLYHDYRHIWSYWNFGGSAADNALPYSEKSKINTHIGEWEERNGRYLRNLVTKVGNGGTMTELSTAPDANGKNDATMPLVLHPSGSKGAILSASNGKRFYGVTIPALSSAPSSETAKDCFQFKTNTKGTITVAYIANGGTLALKGTNITTNAVTTRTINGTTISFAEFYYGENKPQTVYLYSSKGSPTVLDIEFAEDEYIYLTDREGILPSSDHPIPMYGVQKFGKLQGYWDEGASFDLTAGGADDDGVYYNAKTISLLRAVAKIEVLIPKSIGVPRHVYMRSLNRNVRCEPTDVSTPTDLLWKDHDTECEWKAIQNRGTFFTGSGTYTADDYKTKLAWYYGAWLDWGWNFNGMSYKPSTSAGPFPRIMNPYINRSDFAAFIDVTEYYNDQYYHFLFYMGENTLDASSNYQGSGGSVMVPHIEIRFDERYAAGSNVAPNSGFNLDDGDCYRIYFTEGGIAKGARDANGVTTIPKDQYANYERNSTYLKEHWPIIRNHVYRFTVIDKGSDNMSGLVVDAQNRSADFNFK